jgi:hypothetical protein
MNFFQSDPGVTTDIAGTAGGYLRGLVKIFADVWDSANHWLKTQLQASENHIGAIGGHKVTPTSSFSRPAGTLGYSTGSIIANSATAASVVFLSWTVARVSTGTVTINAVRLRKNDAGGVGTTTNAVFRVHLFGAQPTSTSSGDGQTFQGNVRLAGANDYLGYIDVATDQSFQVGSSGTSAKAQNIVVSLASGQTIYGILEARAGYSAASAEQFFVTLEISQD